jgi:hypothetical protein
VENINYKIRLFMQDGTHIDCVSDKFGQALREAGLVPLEADSVQAMKAMWPLESGFDGWNYIDTGVLRETSGSVNA